MWTGTVDSIHIAPAAMAPMQAVDQVEALPGIGLEGDRYAQQQGTFYKPEPDYELTLIEAEAIDGANREYHLKLTAGDTRRNIATRGVPLNHLVGHDFILGKVKVRGIRLCEPCSHLQTLTDRSVIRALRHRGGLRAQILTAGVIRKGDKVTEPPLGNDANAITLRELLRGQGAHVDPVASLEDVPASAAGRTLEGYPHSIWQIVGHMNYWMNYELLRISGQPPAYPEHAIGSWPATIAPANESEWEQARKQFTALLSLLDTLSEAPPEALDVLTVLPLRSQEQTPSSPRTVLWQTLVHNSYHAGQIALLRRSFGLWPPKKGGDTW
jgi:MOSC domain-containing protein YiiM